MGPHVREVVKNQHFTKDTELWQLLFFIAFWRCESKKKGLKMFQNVLFCAICLRKSLRIFDPDF